MGTSNEITSNSLSTGGAGTDAVVGVQGQDWAEFKGQSADYRIDRINGEWVVTDTNLSDGDDGRTVQRNAKGVRFANGQVEFMSKIESEFRVNTTTYLNQRSSRITALKDGGFVVTWESNVIEESRGTTNIFAQRYNAQGQMQGAEFRVNSYTTDSQMYPNITALIDGGFVVTWVSIGQDGDDYGIYAQRYDTQGQVQGNEFRVNSYTKSVQNRPCMTALSDGGFVVTWESYGQDGSGSGIYGQRYNAQGQAQGAEFRVNSYTTNSQYNASITALSDGGFVVTWQSKGQDAGIYDDSIYAQRYNAQGQAQGGEFRVNRYTTGTQDNPSITALSDGGFVVTWVSSRQGGSGSGVYVQRYNAQGQVQGGEFRVTSDSSGYQTDISTTALSNGGFVVVWNSDRRDGNYDEVYARRYDAQAQPQGAEFKVNTYTKQWQSYPSVAATSDGGFVVTWTSRIDQDGSWDGVYAQRYNAMGEPVSNFVLGTSGADTLNVGTGYTAMGGDGDDVYIVSDSKAQIAEDANQGTDTVSSSVTWKLGNNFENLTLTGTAAINGTGNELNNVLVGNAGNNVLDGGTGNDTLDGGIGIDTLKGGLGDDTYVVDTTTDVIVENANEGNDTVQSSMSYTLGANLENLTLTGTAAINGTGNALNNVLSGNAGNNVLDGGAGNDTLDGGLGNDILKGGAGDDTYVVDGAGDVIVENANEGVDAVQSSVSYTLGANIENLTLTGAAAINGTGTDLNNVIAGNSGNNMLNGGAGNDTLKGGLGDDIYVVDSTADVIVENANEGVDTVQSRVSYTLDVNVENLTLTGTSAINGKGNELNNALLGNAANNVLDGGAGNDALDGGAGNDTLKGGLGDDIYVVDGTGDQIVENANEGVDTVQSSVSYTLGANVENLTLTGTAAINGAGNELNNVIIGNSGNNILSGGVGNDTLEGGQGQDLVEYKGQSGDYRIDRINGEWVVTDTNLSDGDDGRDVLRNVESLRFANGALNLAEVFERNVTANYDDEELRNRIAYQITTLRGGGFAFYWSRELGDYHHFYIRRFDPHGLPVGTTVKVGQGNVINSLNLSALRDGGFVAAWSADAKDGRGYVAYAQCFDAQGQEKGPQLLGASNTNENQHLPCIAELRDGGFVMAWQSIGQDDSDGGIYAKRYNAQGQALGSEFKVNSSTAGYQQVPNITSLSDGGFVVTWLSYGPDRGINAQRYNAQGQIQGPQIEALTGDGIASSLILALTDGGFLVAGLTYNQLENVYVNHIKCYDAQSQVSEITAKGGSITALEKGGFIVTTLENGLVHAQRYGNQGQIIGSELVFSGSKNTGISDLKYVNALTDGSFVVWGVPFRQEENGLSIYSRHFTAEGYPTNFGEVVGTSGADTMNVGLGYVAKGGEGDDVYIVSDAQVQIFEDVNQGVDTVRSSMSWKLDGNLENLTLTGVAAINGTGNRLSNEIVGNAGNNVLDGGAGVDTLKGGLGDDTYVVDSTADVIVENANEGVDTVQSSVSYSLGANVENLTLTGTAAISGTGNELNNALLGNASNNVLDGGAGVDTLKGGLGDDTYVVDSTADVIVENANEGVDTVQSSVSYSLGANVENLTLTGTAAINGTGNALNNVIVGNSGNNILNGGAGNDTLKGGLGDDTYVVDSTADVIVENANEGVDAVQSSVSYTLGANLENLTLTGTAAINGTGNALNNVIVGNSGNNVLIGGAGNDTLDGGQGQDLAEYKGQSGDYRIDRISGEWVVTDTNLSDGNDGRDVLRNVEAVRFANGQFELGSKTETEFRVSSYTIGSQSSASITALSDGGFIVTWDSYGQDGSGRGVYAQRYNAQGVAQGQEFRVNTYTEDWQADPSITALSDGGFVVTWNSYGQDGSDFGVYAQRYNAQGWAQGQEFRVNSYTIGSQGSPSITALSDGGFVVTWDSYGQDGSGRGIYAQRYDAQGVAQGKEFRVNSYTIHSQESPRIVALSDGGFVVAWTSEDQDGSHAGVYAQRYNAQGVTQGQEFRVNTYTYDWQILRGITALSDGGFVVTWDSYGQSGSDREIYAQRYDAQGVAQGWVFRVNTYTKDWQGGSSITALSDGGFVVTWTSEGQDGSDFGVYAQRYNAQGWAQGQEFRVNSYTIGSQGSPSITALSDGGFVVTWDSFGQDGSGYRIYAQRYDALGEPVSYFVSGTPGADVMNVGLGYVAKGGLGDDTYLVDAASALVVEGANEGIDTVLASATFFLSANVENLTLTGTAAINGTGNALNNVLLGNLGSNVLDSGTGNDTLDSSSGNDTLKGGAGADTLIGGEGSDVYVFSKYDGADTIIETDTSDIDTLQLTDIKKSELLFALVGKDLEIKVINTNDRILVKDWALKNKESLQIKTSDGLLLSNRAIHDVIAENKTLKVSYIAGTNSSASKYVGYFKRGDVVTVTTEFKAQSNVSGMVFLGDAGGQHEYNNYVSSGPVYGNGEWQTITQTLTMNDDDHVWVYVYGDRDGAHKAAGNVVEYDNLVASSLQRGVVLDDRMNNVTQGVDYYSTSSWCVGGRIEQAGPGMVPQNRTLEVSYVAGTNSSASRFLGNFKAGDKVTVSAQFRAKSDVSGMVFLGDASDNYSNCVSSGPVYGNGEWQTITQTLTMNGNDDLWVYLYGDRDGAHHAAGNVVEYDNLVVSSLQQGVVLDDRMDRVSQGRNELNKNDWYVGGQIAQLTGVYSSDNQNNVLVNGSDFERLSGGVGNDTYVINKGGNLDVILDMDQTIGNMDVLSFGAGITADQLWFSRGGAPSPISSAPFYPFVDLEIRIIGTLDVTIIQNWYVGSQFQIEQIKVGDKTLLSTDVEKLVQAMAAFSVPSSGQSTLPTDYQSTLAPVIAANWH